MADVDAPLVLAAEFPPADHEDWLALAGDLDRLRTTSYDGITIEPLYTATETIAGTGLPGEFPFVRGRTSTGVRDGWDVRQLVTAGLGPRAAVAELERGATSVWLRLDADDPIDETAVGALLDGVLLDVAPVALDAGRRWVAAGRALRAVWRAEHVDPAAVHGSLGADPLGDWTVDRDDDALDAGLSAMLDEARSIADHHPSVGVSTIDGRRFHDAGASDAEELGSVLALVVVYLRTLTDGGFDVAAAFAQLDVRLATTVDQFASIAKFRAARQVLARVAEVAGAPAAASFVTLHAVTSRAMATRYDSAVNIVRATVASFAAAVGGADAVTVLPHDTFAAPSPSELARRLARNTQAVLGLESNVAAVIDPAGGSWYVERLTDELAGRAWDVFQEIEAAGGFRAAVEAGIVERRIAATRAARAADVDHRRAPIVGVTAFPSGPDDAPTDGAGQPTKVRRWTAGFEALRSRVDDAAAGGMRPAVFLARLGTPQSTAGEATSAANFFAIAGLAATSGAPTDDVAQIADAFAGSGTTVAWICAGGDVEPSRLGELRTTLAAAGATRVYAADDLTGDARATLADLLDHSAVP